MASPQKAIRWPSRVQARLLPQRHTRGGHHGTGQPGQHDGVLITQPAGDRDGLQRREQIPVVVIDDEGFAALKEARRVGELLLLPIGGIDGISRRAAAAAPALWSRKKWVHASARTGAGEFSAMRQPGPRAGIDDHHALRCLHGIHVELS